MFQESCSTWWLKASREGSIPSSRGTVKLGEVSRNWVGYIGVGGGGGGTLDRVMYNEPGQGLLIKLGRAPWGWVLYCIVLYCIMRPYTDGPIGPLSYRHSSGVVRNPHSTLAEWGIFNLRSMSSQGTHLLIARRRNSINSVLFTISWMTCLFATREPRTINLSIAGERITFTM